MKFEHTAVTQLNAHIYLLYDDENTSGYLVVGAERAALIDTMNGLDDLREIVRSITDLPLTVINTHGHPDHVGGNVFFGCCKCNRADWEIAQSFMAENEILAQYVKQTGLPMPTFEDIEPGDKFDLGGVTLEAVACKGHTPGGICLLDREDRTLFTGDAINVHLWMQLDHSTGLPSLIESLEALAPIRSEFDTILHGHATGFLPAGTIDDLRVGAQELLAGKTEGDKEYKWFGAPAKQHVYTDKGALIVY